MAHFGQSRSTTDVNDCKIDLDLLVLNGSSGGVVHFSAGLIVVMFYHWFQLPDWYDEFQFAAVFLADLNSALNPIIYNAFNKGFKQSKNIFLKLHVSNSPNFQ